MALAVAAGCQVAQHADTEVELLEHMSAAALIAEGPSKSEGPEEVVVEEELEEEQKLGD